MSRVVNTNSPSKRRNYHMRSCAELLRHLSQKPEFDDEACDMLAALAHGLHEIEAGLDEATEAWEKRDYWLKVEQFRQKWAWAGLSAAELDDVLRRKDWSALPAHLVKLLPYFADITITKMMRSPDLWQGKYAEFLAKEAR